MPKTTPQRSRVRPTLARVARPLLTLLLPALTLGACAPTDAQGGSDPNREAPEEPAMQVQYLEIVTPDVDTTCAALAALHGVTFAEPLAELGNSRTAELASGGRIGVRAPMHDAEDPVVRPYTLVDDLEAAITAAETAGAEFAMKATEIPGQGTFAIYFLGGVQYGLWQL